MNNNIKVEEYLQKIGVKIVRNESKEFVMHCLFSGCDSDSKGKEAHLYMEKETGKYHCKKCEAKGNLVTLQKHFGDWKVKKVSKTAPEVNDENIEKWHSKLLSSPHLLTHLIINRKISLEVIKSKKIGVGTLYNRDWYIVPIKNKYGHSGYLKLRELPSQEKMTRFYPQGSKASIYGIDEIQSSPEDTKVLVCEGEWDKLTAESNGVLAITGTGGASTWKDEWRDELPKNLNYYFAFDTDTAGDIGAEKALSTMHKNAYKKLYKISLPNQDGEKVDIGDYYKKDLGTSQELFEKFSSIFPKEYDYSKWQELDTKSLAEILSSTIKKDDDNKVITFLGMISSYTEESQMNVFFNAPSSAGKSYIALEIAKLFPDVDLISLAGASPTAFIHETGEYNKEENKMVVDLSRKILLFTDMPDTGIIQRLRSVISHDKKIATFKITDKSDEGGNRTKTCEIIGYPSVFYCSANSKVDEQESTRFIMLSPEVDPDKVSQGVQHTLEKETHKQVYDSKVSQNVDRNKLIERILAIKNAKIDEVIIENSQAILDAFTENGKRQLDRVRYQRDIKKVISLVKTFTILNFFNRQRVGNNIYANETDISNGVKLWQNIFEYQEYGLAAYLFRIYKDVIQKLWNEDFEFIRSIDNYGPNYIQIMEGCRNIFGTSPTMIKLRQDIIPALESAGLVLKEYKNKEKIVRVLPIGTNAIPKDRTPNEYFSSDTVSEYGGQNY